MNHASDSPLRNPSAAMRLWFGAALASLALGLVGVGLEGTGAAADPPGANEKTTFIGGLPLFSNWPQDQKPDAVLVLSGETYGFYQPCGCSRPQKGGLERRARFIQTLTAKGWPVAGVDLGDLYPETVALQEQGLLKYKMMMNALREMGYIAVGVGKTEFKVQLDRVLGKYALQKQQPPYTLAGNVLGKAGDQIQPRALRFQVPGATRPTVDESEFAKVGTVPISVSAIVGKSLRTEVQAANWDPSIAFEANCQQYLTGLMKRIQAHDPRPEINIMLFQGTSAEAKLLAGDFTGFQVILCRADDSEPPQFPEVVSKAPGQRTLVIQVGHKGRYVGVVGAFKRADGGFDLKYQLVPLSEEFITPGTEAEAAKSNPVLPLLEGYAKQVKDWKLIDEYPRAAHPAQVLKPNLNLSYVGSDKCLGCHAQQALKWKGSPHAHAFDALAKTAKRPSLRQFDGECIVCHTVGFGYNTGYVNQDKTPNLKNVGCESCHGPGSGHVAAPRAKDLLALQMPWTQNPGDRLPDQKFMAQMAPLNGIQRGQVAVPPLTQLIINKVTDVCTRCHNHENDPNFDLYTNWPKIEHK